MLKINIEKNEDGTLCLSVKLPIGRDKTVHDIAKGIMALRREIEGATESEKL